MCTVTLSYDQNNALARRKLAALLRSGLFLELEKPIEDNPKDLEAYRQEVSAFMEASKKSMSHLIARYL